MKQDLKKTQNLYMVIVLKVKEYYLNQNQFKEYIQINIIL